MLIIPFLLCVWCGEGKAVFRISAPALSLSLFLYAELLIVREGFEIYAVVSI